MSRVSYSSFRTSYESAMALVRTATQSSKLKPEVLSEAGASLSTLRQSLSCSPGHVSLVSKAISRVEEALFSLSSVAESHVGGAQVLGVDLGVRASIGVDTSGEEYVLEAYELYTAGILLYSSLRKVALAGALYLELGRMLLAVGEPDTALEVLRGGRDALGRGNPVGYPVCVAEVAEVEAEVGVLIGLGEYEVALATLENLANALLFPGMGNGGSGDAKGGGGERGRGRGRRKGDVEVSGLETAERVVGERVVGSASAKSLFAADSAYNLSLDVLDYYSCVLADAYVSIVLLHLVIRSETPAITSVCEALVILSDGSAVDPVLGDLLASFAEAYYSTPLPSRVLSSLSRQLFPMLAPLHISLLALLDLSQPPSPAAPALNANECTA